MISTTILFYVLTGLCVILFNKLDNEGKIDGAAGCAVGAIGCFIVSLMCTVSVFLRYLP